MGRFAPNIWLLGTCCLRPQPRPILPTAQAIRPEVGLPYANFSGSISQMLRPFPQYSSVGDPWGNVGNSNYNSMQVILRKATSQGLTFDMNYTLVKAFDNLETRNHYFLSESANDRQHSHCECVGCLPLAVRQRAAIWIGQRGCQRDCRWLADLPE